MNDAAHIKPKILFVTYLDEVAETMIMILNRAGFEGHFVRTAEEMLEQAPQLKPDVIASEILLYPMTGVEAAIRLRETMPSIKFLMFSGGYDAADVLTMARKQGHEFEVIALPFHPQEMVNKLCSLIGKTPVQLKTVGLVTQEPAEVGSPPPRRIWDSVRNFFRH